MRIRKEDVPFYDEYNREFNSVVGPLIGDMFQAYSVGPEGYASVRYGSGSETFGWTPRRKTRVISEPYKAPDGEAGCFDLGGVAQYERMVFSCLAWGNFNTYVLTGEFGSGKSATVRYILDVLARPRTIRCPVCSVCSPVLIYLSFTKGFVGKDVRKLVSRFRRRLSDQLRMHLRRLFRENRLTAKLLEETRKGEDDLFEPFDRLAQKFVEEDEWKNLTEQQKTNKLLDFANVNDDIERSLELLMVMFLFVKRYLRPRSSCLVLVFDNIDSIAPEAQYEILLEILAYLDFCQVKSLIVVRQTTFDRLEVQAAYSFGVIKFFGPDVAAIIAGRIQYYQENWHSIPHLQLLRPEYSEAIKRRLDYFADSIGDPRGAIELIRCLSGGCVRLGLTIAERVFINANVPWNHNPSSRDDLARGVLAGDCNRIEVDDRSVANVFVDRASGHFSLLPLRILHLLQILSDLPSQKNVLNLRIILKSGGWTSEQIRVSINYLLLLRRPLIWVDGREGYANLAEMQECDDTLYLTESGYHYLTKMIRNLVYVQEALIGVSWPRGVLPESVNYESTVDRFSILRRFLSVVSADDYVEVRKLKGWMGRVKRGVRFDLDLMSNRILESVGSAAVNILCAVRGGERELAIDEIRNWQSLIIEGLNKGEELGILGKGLARLSQSCSMRLRSLEEKRRNS